MLPLEDSRLLKPAKSLALAPSPLQTKLPSTPSIHASSSPRSAYQAYRQGERHSSPVSQPKPSVHPHLPSGHISSPPRPAVRKESEWSVADEKLAIRRAQKTITPAKFSKPLVTHEDDARETRRFQNQVSTGRIANKLTAHHTSGSANDVTKGILIGTRKLSPPSSAASHPPSSLPNLPESWTERERQLGRTDKPSRGNLETSKAKGRIMDRAWEEHYNSRPDVKQVVSQPTWKHPETGKTMSFPDAKSRRPDLRIDLKNGITFAHETKATPHAAEASSARKQIHRDRTAIKDGAVLGKGDSKHVKVNHAIIKDSLPILGPGGNTALPGEVQKHVMITPRDTSQRARAFEKSGAASATEGALRGGVAKGVLRGASRAALPLAAAVDAYDLTKTYQKDGFGAEFRSKAAGVAGGWAGAAAGAELGATIGSFVPIPGVGTVAGGLIGGGVGYLVGSGAASKLEEGAEKLGKGAVEGAKNLWHGVFG
jgi:hypothetical protein